MVAKQMRDWQNENIEAIGIIDDETIGLRLTDGRIVELQIDSTVNDAPVEIIGPFMEEMSDIDDLLAASNVLERNYADAKFSIARLNEENDLLFEQIADYEKTIGAFEFMVDGRDGEIDQLKAQILELRSIVSRG